MQKVLVILIVFHLQNLLKLELIVLLKRIFVEQTAWFILINKCLFVYFNDQIFIVKTNS